jgi:hypothetical protein
MVTGEEKRNIKEWMHGLKSSLQIAMDRMGMRDSNLARHITHINCGVRLFPGRKNDGHRRREEKYQGMDAWERRKEEQSCSGVEEKLAPDRDG